MFEDCSSCTWLFCDFQLWIQSLPLPFWKEIRFKRNIFSLIFYGLMNSFLVFNKVYVTTGLIFVACNKNRVFHNNQFWKLLSWMDSWEWQRRSIEHKIKLRLGYDFMSVVTRILYCLMDAFLYSIKLMWPFSMVWFYGMP